MSKLCIIFLMNLFFFCFSQKQPQYVNLNSLRNLNEDANQTILLGFDNFTIDNKNLSFNTYFLFKNWLDNNKAMYDTLQENFFIDTNIITYLNNTRFKQTFNCSFTSKVNWPGTGECGQVKCEKQNYTEKNPKKIQIIYNSTLYPFNGTITSIGPFANASKNDLTALKNKAIFNEEINILENVTLLTHKGSYFKIKTGDENDINGFNFNKNHKNIQLIVFSNGDKKIIKCKSGEGEDKNENKYYYIETDGINPSINGELQYAILNAINRTTNQNEYFMLDFGPNDGNSTLSPETTYYKKSSGGLSTGGIIAVLIPCILLLLGVGALVYLLGMRKPPQPISQVVNNNTIGVGVTSSENIMNK